MSDIRLDFERDCAPQGIAMVHYDEKTGKYSPNDSGNSAHINIAFSANTALWAYEAAHKAQQAEIERLKERVDEWVDFATSHSAPFRAKCGHLVNRGWVCQVCGQDPTEALEGNQ